GPHPRAAAAPGVEALAAVGGRRRGADRRRRGGGAGRGPHADRRAHALAVEPARAMRGHTATHVTRSGSFDLKLIAVCVALLAGCGGGDPCDGRAGTCLTVDVQGELRAVDTVQLSAS